MSLPLLFKRHPFRLARKPVKAATPQSPKQSATGPKIPVKPLKRPADQKALRQMFRKFLQESITPKRRGAGVRMMHVLDRLEAWGDSLGLRIVALPHPRDLARWCREEGIQIYKGAGGYLRLCGWDLN